MTLMEKVITAVVIVIVAVCYEYIITKSDECKKAGGALVQGVLGWECIKK